MKSGLLSGFGELDRVALVAEHGAGLDFARASVSLTHIGPILELATRAQVDPAWSKFAKANLPGGISSSLRDAHKARLHTRIASIGEKSFGFMCLANVPETTFRPALHQFDLAARRFMRFRRNAAQSRGLVCGAIGEMIDNVLEHSGAIGTGIVAFAGTADHFDICVSDAGMGVLASLRLNPAFAYLADAGMALSLAIQHGSSRYPTAVEEGRGTGFSTLFRGLNSLDAEIRIRSGDYVLEVGGHALRDRAPAISQKDSLTGLVVSFRTYF